MNLGILISGRGSNMEAIIRHIREKRIPINVAVVVSSKGDAKGLHIAKKLGVETEVVESRGFPGSREEYDRSISAVLHKHGVTNKDGLVCLAGFMRILGSEFVRKYKNKILNIHPALLPSFPGLNAQRQALESGIKITGCTVHIVDEGVDSGPVVLKSEVPIQDGDTEESLSERILSHEHQIYPESVELFARGRVTVSNRRVKILSLMTEELPPEMELPPEVEELPPEDIPSRTEEPPPEEDTPSRIVKLPPEMEEPLPA